VRHQELADGDAVGDRGARQLDTRVQRIRPQDWFEAND
jgi:hypothetical protein